MHTHGPNLSEAIAIKVCNEYLDSVSSNKRHPLHLELSSLNDDTYTEMTLFAQDVAELVGFILSNIDQDGYHTVAAQSARRILDRHPSWTLIANDWALLAQLSDKQIHILSYWLI